MNRGRRKNFTDQLSVHFYSVICVRKDSCSVWKTDVCKKAGQVIFKVIAGSVPVPRVSNVFVMSRYSAKMWYFTFWHFCIFLCHRQFLSSFEYKCHASPKDYKYFRTSCFLYICLAQRMPCSDSFFHSWMKRGIQNWHKWNKTKTEDTAQANLKITLFFSKSRALQKTNKKKPFKSVDVSWCSKLTEMLWMRCNIAT